MGAEKKGNMRMRRRLGTLARIVAEWKRALDHVRDDCPHELRADAMPGSGLDGPCVAGKRCRVVTVLSIRVHAQQAGINLTHLKDDQVPTMVAALAELFSYLPVTRDWRAFATALQEIVLTGDRPANADALYPSTSAPAEGAVSSQPKEHHQ